MSDYEQDPLLTASRPPGYIPPTGFDDSEGTKTFIKNSGPKKIFSSRDELDQIIFWDKGEHVTIEGWWHELEANGEYAKNEKGEYIYTNKVWVPRVTGAVVEQVTQQISSIIAALFPHRSSFFISEIDFARPMSASAEIHQILFGTVYPEIKQIIKTVLGLSNDKFSLMMKALMPVDIIAIFCQIISQEINNPQMEAISHQIQSLLVERFRLENVLQQFLESTDLTRPMSNG